MDRIFYRSEVVDTSTNLPIFIFDTSYLPSTDLINYDAFIPTMMNYIPQEPYALVMFNCGLNKISWIWGIKFLKQFLDNEDYDDNLSKLLKIYTVHDSWFVKSITQIFNTKKNLVSLQKLIDSFSIQDIQQAASQISINKSQNVINKKNTPIVRCANLSELSNFIDITKLKISLNIYKHNLQLEKEIQLKTALTLFDTAPSLSNPIFNHHFYQLFKILDNYAPKVELIFHKPGNKLNTEILFQCISRDQLIWINDWDLWCIGGCFKKILADLPQPLIAIDAIQLPMNDSLEYTLDCFKNILNNLRIFKNDQLLFQFMNLLSKIIENQIITHHTSLSLSRCVSHSLSHEAFLLNKDRISIINRFIKNLLDNWVNISSTFSSTYLTVDEVINGKEESDKNFTNKKTQNFNSYDISYDLTIDNDDEDLEYRVAFNTSNILTEVNLKSKEKSTIPITNNINMHTSPLRPERSTRDYKFNLLMSTGYRNQSESFSSACSTPNQNHSISSSTSMSSMNTIITPLGHSSSKSVSSITFVPPPVPKKLHSSSKSISSINSIQPVVQKPTILVDTPSNNKPSPSPTTSKTQLKSSWTSNASQASNITSTLKDVSNIAVQYPPQKYKFQKYVTTPTMATHSPFSSNLKNKSSDPDINPSSTQSPVKKPVIRGRKVGELAKLFEERAEAMEILNTM